MQVCRYAGMKLRLRRGSMSEQIQKDLVFI